MTAYRRNSGEGQSEEEAARGEHGCWLNQWYINVVVRGNGQNIWVFRIPLDCANHVFWRAKCVRCQNQNRTCQEDRAMKTQEISLTEHRQWSPRVIPRQQNLHLMLTRQSYFHRRPNDAWGMGKSLRQVEKGSVSAWARYDPYASWKPDND